MPRSTAVRPPATRDQVDAYRFGLRRLEAALVRGDPVPLHEQIRSQRRAVLVGALLGLLAIGGVAVFALIVPRPDWKRQAVVVGKESGAMYVVAHGPDRLVPVANLAAGRLVLAALARGGSGSAGAAAGAAVPVVVPDDELGAAPRTATAAVPGAEGVRPEGPGVPPRWAVCDTVTPDGSRLVGTTVVAGADLPPEPSGQAPSGQAPSGPAPAALLAVPGGSTWFVTGGRRHRVDPQDRALLATLGLAGRTPRPATAGLVSALAEGPALVTPEPAGRGGPAPPRLPGRVGDVLVMRPGGGMPRHYVVLTTGLQEVPPVLGELLRVASGAATAREIGPDVLARAALVDDLPVAGWPAAAPPLLDPATDPTLCWTWTAGAGGMLAGAAPPVPPGSATVVLAQADGPGERVDAMVLGDGGAVRATGPGRAPGAGPIWLLSATGVGYGVADAATAEALGITRTETAPEAALRLLPSGPVLDVGATVPMVDVLRAGGRTGR